MKKVRPSKKTYTPTGNLVAVWLIPQSVTKAGLIYPDKMDHSNKREANKFIRWATRNPDGGQYDGVDLTREQLESRITRAEQFIDEAIPNRLSEITKDREFKALQTQARRQVEADCRIFKNFKECAI